MRLFFLLSLVEVTPTGPLPVDLNTSITINCSVEDTHLTIQWNIIYKNNTALNAVDIPGVKITYSNLSSSLTLDVMDISTTGIQCREYIGRDSDVTFRRATTVGLIFPGMLIL